MTSDLPPWAGSVDATALARLLALQSEHDWLDYKRQCDLSSTRGLVEFAKDVGAMMITGGYILVGADDNGQPAGDVERADLLDPAKLHNKLANTCRSRLRSGRRCTTTRASPTYSCM